VILGQETITLRRVGAGSRGADGRWSDGVAVDTSIAASVQPLGGRELATLPEGERHSDQIKVYTTTEIRTGSQHDGTTADRLVVDGIVYEVRAVEQQRAILPHYKARAVRVKE
jgi:hypothetical protein